LGEGNPRKKIHEAQTISAEETRNFYIIAKNQKLGPSFAGLLSGSEKGRRLPTKGGKDSYPQDIRRRQKALSIPLRGGVNVNTRQILRVGERASSVDIVVLGTNWSKEGKRWKTVDHHPVPRL